MGSKNEKEHKYSKEEEEYMLRRKREFKIINELLNGVDRIIGSSMKILNNKMPKDSQYVWRGFSKAIEYRENRKGIEFSIGIMDNANKRHYKHGDYITYFIIFDGSEYFKIRTIMVFGVHADDPKAIFESPKFKIPLDERELVAYFGDRFYEEIKKSYIEHF